MLVRETRWLRLLILMPLIAFGILQFPAPVSRAASPSLADNPTTTQKAVTYITDVVGKRVRIVGPRFYPNPARRLVFSGPEHGVPGHSITKIEPRDSGRFSPR